MREEIPYGWVETTLGALTAPSRVRLQPVDEPNLPYIGMEHVEPQTMKLLGRGEVTNSAGSLARFSKGDILYGKMRPYLNKVWVAEFDGLCSTEFLVFPRVEGVSNQLLAYRLNSQDFVNFANRLVSGDRPRVDFGKLAKFPILLPPSSEQDRIVRKLRELLSRVSAGEEAARRALDRLQRYRTAVLHAAITGKLTREWRESFQQNETGDQLLEQLLAERRTRWREAELKHPRLAGSLHKKSQKNRYSEPAAPKLEGAAPIPDSWAYASLDQLLFNVTDGDHQSPPKSISGVPLLVIGNLRNGELDFSETRFVPKSYAHNVPSLKKPQRNDILYTLVGSFGIAVTVRTDAEFCIQRHIAILRPHPLSPTKYLSQILNAEFVYRQADRYATGTAQRTVSLASLRQFAIPLPPRLEQKEIIHAVERRLTAAEQLAKTLSGQLEQARITRQSLLREAFRGRLVPQDPSDEPASLLLKRISDSREVKAAQPKTKRMLKRKVQSVETLEQLEELVQSLSPEATPERLVVAAGLEGDVEKFFDLLRAGRDKGSLLVPTGTNAAIARNLNAS